MSGDYDLLIKGTTIVDGTGRPAFDGSIGIRGDKIAAVGNINGDSEREIEGTGLVICPGFIDMHSHADLSILQYPLAENLVMQGVTTFVGGNCGLSLAPLQGCVPSSFFESSWWHEIEPYSYAPPALVPLDKYGEILKEKLTYAIDWRTFDDFLSRVEQVGISINYVPLVGHNAVRFAVMGEDFNRRATPGEIEQMGRHVDEAMEAGAFGLATGLDYLPGEFAATEELIALGKVAQQHGGLYASHLRHQNNDWPSDDLEEYGYGIYHGRLEEIVVGRYHGMLEALEVGRKARIPIHISHISNVYIIPQPHHDSLEVGVTKATLDIIDRAREEGLDVTFDVIIRCPVNRPPMIGVFSKWLKLFGRDRFIQNLKMREFREELKRVIDSGRFKFVYIHPKTDPYWMDCFKILRCKHHAYEGKTIGEISRTRGTDPVETVFDLLIEDPDTQWHASYKRTSPAAIPVFLKHPVAMLSTDVRAVDIQWQVNYPVPGAELPDPGWYGLWPHYIGTYVRDKGVLGLEEAVQKATYLPAQRLGLRDRGVIRPGACADLVVFDYQRIRMKGELLDPAQAPEGMAYVLVNGQVVYEEMAHTGARSGKVLRHK